MAMRAFYNEIRGLKVVGELPAHLKPKLRWENVKKTVERGCDRYIDKYIETSSVEPLFHVCIGGMIFSPRSAATSSTPPPTTDQCRCTLL